jgi:cytochrome P450
MQFSHGALEERAADKTSKRRDFAHILVEARGSEKKGAYMTEGECAMASVVLTIAGTDTTSNTMTFITYLLAKHRNVQDKLYQELVKIMPSRDDVLKYKEVRKEGLPYLWAVIMEVTRMMPVVPVGMPRICPKGGEVIAGRYIPQGVRYYVLTRHERRRIKALLFHQTIVEVPVWSIHYHPDIFEDPYKFRPERWLEPGADELTKYNIAFSVGPRMCAGKKYVYFIICKQCIFTEIDLFFD